MSIEKISKINVETITNMKSSGLKLFSACYSTIISFNCYLLEFKVIIGYLTIIIISENSIFKIPSCIIQHCRDLWSKKDVSQHHFISLMIFNCKLLKIWNFHLCQITTWQNEIIWISAGDRVTTTRNDENFNQGLT